MAVDRPHYYMTQSDFAKRVPLLAERLLKILTAKNTDYSGTDDAFRNLRRHGMHGVMVRLWDKYNRLENFIDRGQLEFKQETEMDAAMDMAGYAFVLICLMEEANANQSNYSPTNSVAVAMGSSSDYPGYLPDEPKEDPRP